MIESVRREVRKYQNPEKAKLLEGYFKTGKGQYAEGDLFLGLMVPQSRMIAKLFSVLPKEDIEKLFHSKFHEERLIALFILVDQFKKGTPERKKEIYDFYLANTEYINNWDLVDMSADKIVGEYVLAQCNSASSSNHSPTLVQGDKIKVLIRLAKSENIWERRIAILSTFAFIHVGRDDVTYKLADILLHDPHDLIHKAVGWLLREAGKRVSMDGEEAFLKTRYKVMPRTMLRYAIERFPKEKREKYLNGEV